MLFLVFLFFALPIVGIIVLIRTVGERSSGRSIRRVPPASNGARLRPH